MACIGRVRYIVSISGFHLHPSQASATSAGQHRADLQLKSTTSVALSISYLHGIPALLLYNIPRLTLANPPHRSQSIRHVGRGGVEKSRTRHGTRSGQRGRTTSFPPRHPNTTSFRGAETLHSKTRAPPPCYRAVLQSLVSAVVSSEERGARNFRQENDRHGAQAAVRPAYPDADADGKDSLSFPAMAAARCSQGWRWRQQQQQSRGVQRW